MGKIHNVPYIVLFILTQGKLKEIFNLVERNKSSESLIKCFQNLLSLSIHETDLKFHFQNVKMIFNYVSVYNLLEYLTTYHKFSVGMKNLNLVRCGAWKISFISINYL